MFENVNNFRRIFQSRITSPVTLFRTALFLTFGSLFSTPLYAQDAASALSCSAGDIKGALATAWKVPSAADAGASALLQLKAVHEKCGDEPNLELAIAYAFSKRAGFSDLSVAEKATALDEAWNAMDKIEHWGNRPQEHQTYIDVGKDVAKQMVALSNAQNQLFPKFSQKAPLKYCPKMAGLINQELFYDYKKHPIGYAPLYTQKIADSCPPKILGSYTSPIYWNALLLNFKAENAASPDLKYEQLKAVRVELEKWLGANEIPGTTKTEVVGILRALAKLDAANGVKPIAVFSDSLQSGLGRPYLEALIGYNAALIWDGSVRVSTQEGKDKYRAQHFALKDYVSTLDELAKSEGIDAQTLLFTALSEFSEGGFSEDLQVHFIGPALAAWMFAKPVSTE